MLVAKDGEEKVILPPTPADETEGSYVLTNLGTLQRTKPGDMESSESEEETIERIYPEEGSYHLLIRRNFHATPKGKLIDQRESVFQTKCRVQDRVCNLMIDGGSETNCVSKQLVQDLKLHTIDHPTPYKLRWLDNKAEGYVKKQSLVSFAIGSYNDEMLCDVIDINVCHILLGRPWQHAKHSIHNGFTNVYTIKHNGIMKELIPLPPCKTMAITTKQNKASCALTKIKCCNAIQKGRKPVHLLMKKTKADQNQQQIKALKTYETASIDLELFKPMTNNVTELNKLHHESSITLCDIDSFYFIEDTIVNFSSCCRYFTDSQQVLQRKKELGMNTITKRTQCNTIPNKDTKHVRLQDGTLIGKHLNLLHSYGISETFNLDDSKKLENNAELRTIMFKEGGIDAIMNSSQLNNKIEEHNCIMTLIKPIEPPCAKPNILAGHCLYEGDHPPLGLNMNMESRQRQVGTPGSLSTDIRLNRKLVQRIQLTEQA